MEFLPPQVRIMTAELDWTQQRIESRWKWTVKEVPETVQIFKIPDIIFYRSQKEQASRPDEPCSLADLPAEIQNSIFKELRWADLISLTMSCRALAKITLQPAAMWLFVDPVLRDYENRDATVDKLMLPICITKVNTYKLGYHPSTNPVASNMALYTGCRYCQGGPKTQTMIEVCTNLWFRHLQMELRRLGMPATRGMMRLVAMELILSFYAIIKKRGTYIERRGETDQARDLQEAQLRFEIWVCDTIEALDERCPR